MKKVRILSLDGGGIRGIIPATILEYLEKELQRRSGNDRVIISDYFDMIAGTSTGGILAALYLAGSVAPDEKKREFGAKASLALYKQHGKEIFTPRVGSGGVFTKISKLFKSTYSARNLESILRERLGEVKSSDLEKASLITSYDISERRAVLFTTPLHDEDHIRDFYLRDIARSTSAAPTYFEPALVQSQEGMTCSLIDGAMFANDPTLCALVEARKNHFSRCDGNPEIEDMFILSIGTGKVLKKYDYEKVRKWGIGNWAMPILNIMMSSSAEVVNYQVDKLFLAANCSSDYIRLDPDLGLANSEMDDVSDKNLAHLENAARNYINQHQAQLNTVIQKIMG